LTHEVELINHKILNDGQVAVLARCCGTENTDSWLTMASSVVAHDTQCQDAINFHCERVANQHDAMLAALSILPNIVGTSRQVTLPTPAPVPPVPPPAPQTTAT
jgi:hypothetical protein